MSCVLAGRHKSSVWNGNSHVTGVPHMFIFKAFSSLKKKKNSFAERAPEKRRRGKPLESVIQLKMSARLPPTTSEAPTLAAQISC